MGEVVSRNLRRLSSITNHGLFRRLHSRMPSADGFSADPPTVLGFVSADRLDRLRAASADRNPFGAGLGGAF